MQYSIDYTVSISTSSPILINLLVKVNDQQVEFLEVFSKTQKERVLYYFQNGLEFFSEDRVRLTLAFTSTGLDESVFESISETYSDGDTTVVVEAIPYIPNNAEEV